MDNTNGNRKEFTDSTFTLIILLVSEEYTVYT